MCEIFGGGKEPSWIVKPGGGIMKIIRLTLFVSSDFVDTKTPRRLLSSRSNPSSSSFGP